MLIAGRKSIADMKEIQVNIGYEWSLSFREGNVVFDNLRAKIENQRLSKLYDSSSEI